eukprot:gene36812-23638_t
MHGLRQEQLDDLRERNRLDYRLFAHARAQLRRWREENGAPSAGRLIRNLIQKVERGDGYMTENPDAGSAAADAHAR